MKPAFDFAVAPLRSSDDSISLIHQLKLLKHPELGADLAGIVANFFHEERRLRELKEPLLIPVPLSGKRLRERQFNQAEVIARPLGTALDFPVLQALRRVKDTQRQATLSRKERLKNLRKSFALRVRPEVLAGQNLILIDDVFTTGSTAQECSKVLRAARPASITVLTVVRA
ncbi:ComF family protein [Roseibacillus persicicus]|uniref:Phosphoribosyltransferase domain-containing protein n=1 Tax=Roseibacillus persicicus TaxID=454148 RepID=A0A918TY79_9BACT|nr:ComF family protein [Roseibacillus persicicus]GHC65610.1 hypothetical protein GCM10007100_36790 [Roseibacillus persicicus]